MLRHATRVNPTATTFSSFPAASSVTPYTQRYFSTDVGVYGSYWYSTGTIWVPEVPVLLYQALVPMVNPTSGTMGDNGAISGLTAFPVTFSLANTQGCFIYLPADAIFTGSTAGYYYTIMADTTSGTVYQEKYTSGTQVVPSTPTPWVCTGPGAFVADINILDAHSYTLPAGAAQAGSSRIIYSANEFMTGDTNSKVLRFVAGTTIVYSVTNTTATTRQVLVDDILTLTGVTGTSYPRNGSAAGTGAPTTAPVMSTTDFSSAIALGSRISTGNVASHNGLFYLKIYLTI